MLWDAKSKVAASATASRSATIAAATYAADRLR